MRRNNRIITQKYYRFTYIQPIKEMPLTYGLATIEQVVDYQNKRFKKPHNSYTATQLGLIQKAINKGNDLFELVKNGRLQLKSVTSANMSSIKLQIQNPTDTIMAKIIGGTLLVPAAPNSDDQTLICTKDQYFTVTPGISNHIVTTMCHDMEKGVPYNKNFVLANIQQKDFKPEMSQSQVWQISVKDGKLKDIQDWGFGPKDNVILMEEQQYLSFCQICSQQRPA